MRCVHDLAVLKFHTKQTSLEAANTWLEVIVTKLGSMLIYLLSTGVPTGERLLLAISGKKIFGTLKKYFSKPTKIIANNQSIWVNVVIVLGGEDAVLSLAGHPQQALDVLLVLVPCLGVPEGDGRVLPVRLLVHVDDGLGEVGPPIVGPDVGEVDEGVDGEGYAQGTALPGTG